MSRFNPEFKQIEIEWRFVQGRTQRNLPVEGETNQQKKTTKYLFNNFHFLSFHSVDFTNSSKTSHGAVQVQL